MNSNIPLNSRQVYPDRPAFVQAVPKSEERKKVLVNKLVISTLFLTSLVLFTSPFEFYIFYIPVLALFPFFIKRLGFSRNLFIFFIVIGLASLYGVAVENNTLPNFLKVYLSIIVLYSFYYYAIAYNKFNAYPLFKIYLYFARIVAIIALIQFVSYTIGFTPGYNFRWLFNKYTLVASENYIRLSSIIAEPSQYAFVMAPAMFVSLYALLYNNTFFVNRKTAILILGTTILTYSTHAYIVIFMSVLFVLMKRFNLLKSIVFLSILITGFVFIYNTTPIVQRRVDDSVLIIKDAHRINDQFFLSKLNTSSFTLLNNSVIALRSFESNPLVGSGLGSHPISFNKYSITRQRYLPFQDFNTMDANSLFLRLLSETGMLGLFAILFILVRYRYTDSRNTVPWVISHAILVMIIAALLREGHYYLSGVPLFIFMYIYIKKYGVSINPK